MIHRLQTYFEHHAQGLASAYLYGSVARSEQKQGSDIDIAILYQTEPAPTFDGLGLALSSDLERHLGQTVDLVVLNHAPVDLVHRVLRDGVLVYDGDPSRRIRFEVYTRNMYFDLLPYLRQYRRRSVEPQF